MMRSTGSDMLTEKPHRRLLLGRRRPRSAAGACGRTGREQSRRNHCLGAGGVGGKRATTTVPIVIAFSGDPVGDGVVSSLARPGGNITGFSYMSTDLAAKRLELLSTAFSKNSRIGVLYNPLEPTRLEMQETEAAASMLGVTLQPLAARHPDDLEQAFTVAVRERADALLVFTHGFAVLNLSPHHGIGCAAPPTHVVRLARLRGRGRAHVIGPDIQVLVRQAASYVDRIIRGEKPGNLPVEQPARLRLSINLQTAKALGLDVPTSILLRADEVIE